MKAPESPIDVKMYEFDRMIDGLLDASHKCEIEKNPRRYIGARTKYKEARELLRETIRSAVASAMAPQNIFELLQMAEGYIRAGAWREKTEPPYERGNAYKDHMRITEVLAALQIDMRSKL